MVDKKRKVTRTQELILYYLDKYGPLGTGELQHRLKEKTNVKDDETILINCRQLVKRGWIYDKENKHGKYKLVEQSKIPAFLSFRSHNRSLSIKIIKDIFSSITNRQQKELEYFSNKIGIYILYILIERTRPEGQWTIAINGGSKLKDPRMKNIDLLRETWLTDTLDPAFILEQFNKYVSNNQNYQELVKKFESTFPDIYKKIVFHEKVVEMRRLRKDENQKQKKQRQESEGTEENHWEKIRDEFIENSQKRNEDIAKSQYYNKLNNNKI